MRLHQIFSKIAHSPLVHDRVSRESDVDRSGFQIYPTTGSGISLYPQFFNVFSKTVEL